MQIAEPVAFVLDYDGNCKSAEAYAATLPTFISIMREAYPTIPILVMSHIKFAAEALEPSRSENRRKKARVAEQVVGELRQAGDKHITFLNGQDLLTDDDYHECTVDGVHPTDLGFFRIAANVEPVIKMLLHMP